MKLKFNYKNDKGDIVKSGGRAKMRFWWEAFEDTDWKKALKTELRDLPQMEAKLKILQIRRKADRPKTTASWSLVPGCSGPGDSTGRFVVSLAELDEQIYKLQTHSKDLRIAIESLLENEKKLIESRYLRREPWKEIECMLKIEEWQRERMDEKALNQIYEILNFR